MGEQAQNIENKPQEATPATPKKVGIKWLYILLPGLILLGLVSAGFLYYNQYYKKDKPSYTVIKQKTATDSAKKEKTPPPPPPPSVVDETADWKVFESKIHYYGISYPKDWTFERHTSEVATDIFNESVYLNTNETENKTSAPNIKIIGGYDYNNLCKTKDECEKESIGFERVELGGKSVTKWTNTGLADEVYYVKPSSNYYFVIFVNYGGDTVLTNEILSTFKFLD